MLLATLGHFYAFSYKEYAGANIGRSSSFTGSLAHALSINDFYHDTVHQFAPTYHDYVLYNHGDKGNEGPTKYRSRTFVPTGHEMDAVTNKVNDIQLSTPPSSASNTPMRSVSGHPEGMRSSIPRHIPIYATKPPGATKDSNTI
ncbi:unnamed protein product [Rhodiola kirilowii]